MANPWLFKSKYLNNSVEIHHSFKLGTNCVSLTSSIDCGCVDFYSEETLTKHIAESIYRYVWPLSKDNLRSHYSKLLKEARLEMKKYK